MNLWQLRWSTEGRLAFFPDEARRRAAVRALVRVAGPRLLLFALVDDHVHAVIESQGSGRSEARSIRMALLPLSASPIDPPWLGRVEDRGHLRSLVRYDLGQPDHHGLALHPALWTGSCFPDLVGARRLPGFANRLAEQLPRLTRAELFRWVHLPDVAIEPATDAGVRVAGAARLVGAATAVLAVGPALAGRAADAVSARAAVCRLAEASGIARAEVVHALGVPLRTAQRLAHHPVDDALLDAVRRRLSLEDLAARTPRPPPVASDAEPPGYGD